MPFFKKMLSKCAVPIHSVSSAAFLLAIFGVLSRLLGLFRDRLLASQFGAGDVLDVYYASFRIPDFLYSLLIIGALSAAFIPIFTEVSKKEGDREAWNLSSRLLVLFIVCISIISAACFLFMPFLAEMIAPGFHAEKLEMVSNFTRIMFLSPLLLGVSALFGGILVSRKSFIVYSAAPLFYNIGIIIGVVFFVQWFGDIGLAWGVVLGALLHGIFQFGAVHQQGFRFSFQWHSLFGDNRVKKVLRLMGPQALAASAVQINFIVITAFASMLSAGSLAVYTFANNLQSIPLALFGISFGVAAFPKLSSLAVDDDKKEFAHTLLKTMRRILYFVVPASMLLILLRAQIVRVVLGAGGFNWDDTVLTFQVLGIMSVSLFAQSLLPLLARSFYSLQDTKTPFLIALVSQVCNIVLATLLLKQWHIYGLAFSFTVSSSINFVLLFFFLRKKIGEIGQDGLTVFLPKLFFASAVSAVAVQIIKMSLGNVTDLDTFLEVFLQLIVSGTAGIVIFVAMSAALRIEEFQELKEKLFIKVFGRSQTVSVPERDELE